MQLGLVSVLVWLLPIFQSASALQQLDGLRGKEAIQDNMLIHRRGSSIEGTMGNRELNQHASTSIYENIIFGNIGGGSNNNNHQQIETIESTSGLQKLIVGGTDAKTVGNAQETRYPWFARTLGNVGETISACGGSLVAPDVVITAAHCDDPSMIMIGPYNLKEIRGGNVGSMVRRGVTNISRHPQWGIDQSQRQDYDVMLVSLDEPILSIAPIRMNFDDTVPSVSGEELQILGFGSVIGGPETGLPNGPNQQSDILQQASSKYVPFEECAVSFDPVTDIRYGVGTGPQQTIVKDFWLCTLNENTSTCYGDSGGPVIREGSNANNDLLLGVISGATGYCGNPYLPLLNNRVSSHQDWIKSVGCGMSRSPPSYWNCPERDDDDDNLPPPVAAPVQAPATTPVSAPVNFPFPVTTPTNAPTNVPTVVPTISPAPSVSFAPTEITTSPDVLLILVATGVGVIAVAGSIGMWLLLCRRRRKRIDDADQNSKDDRDTSKPKFWKRKKTSDGDESPVSSLESSRRSFVSIFKSDKSSKEDSSHDYDPESQQRLDEFSSDTHDITPQDTDESPENVVDNSTKKKRRFFPSFFKKKEQKAVDDEETSEAEQEISFFEEEDNYDDIENVGADGGERIHISHPNINDENRAQYETLREVLSEGYRPRETESMAVQPDKQVDDTQYESTSMIARADDEKDYVNDFVFPRTYAKGRRPPSSRFDDDIQAVVQRGRRKTPSRSRSLDRSQANNYSNKQFDRIRPRSYSQEPSRASNYGQRRKPARSRSMERNGANHFSRERNDRSRPQNRNSSREQQENRSRGRSTQRFDKRNSALGNYELHGDPPGEVYADRLIRPTSLDRARASKYANNGSASDYAGRKRSTSMDRSGAGKFASNNSTSNKYSDRRRSSSLDRSQASNFARNNTSDLRNIDRRRTASLDRSGANNFARGKDAYPNKISRHRQEHAKTPPRDNGVVEKVPKAGVVITKKADGSIVHEVKRRREDGALVTTRTKYANAKLARKYGIPV